MDWVEASGKSVDLAVEAALAELGLGSKEAADIEVLQEAKAGFLGLGAQEAIVKVTPKPADRKPRRRRGRGKSGQRTESEGGAPPDEAGRQSSSAGGGRSGRDDRSRQDRPRGGNDGRPATDTKEETGGGRGRRSSSGPNGSERRGRKPDQRSTEPKEAAVASTSGNGTEKESSIEEQAEVAVAFIKGLLEAFGLEGEVTTDIDDEVLKIDVTGDQTEALVGAKGVVMQAVLEITRTVVQRRTFGAPRMRLDIGGYNERRRQALKIYAGKLAEKLIAEGGEIMLEPMNAADRKVVHDAIAEIDGIRSFSEGEDPDRAVVLAAD
jgi:spoIIIJ-associated protein